MDEQQCSHSKPIAYTQPAPGGAAWVPPGQGSGLVQWLLTIQSDGKVQFKRLCNGTVDESYRTATASEAPAWAAAVVSGFEPPRLLVPSDRPRSIGVA